MCSSTLSVLTKLEYLCSLLFKNPFYPTLFLSCSFYFYIWCINFNCSLILCDRTMSVPQFVYFPFDGHLRVRILCTDFFHRYSCGSAGLSVFSTWDKLLSSLRALCPGSGIRQHRQVVWSR